MNDKLDVLKRFFSNKYSRNDYMGMKKLVFSPDNELEELMQLHWKGFNAESGNSPEFSELARLAAEKPSGKTARRKIMLSFSKVAAILFFPLLLSLGVLYFQFNEYLSQKDVYVEISSPTGSRTYLNLPDGSGVWLNGGSQIRYPSVFKKHRQVELNGEAFFKVKSDTEHPFFVSADEIIVQATGTEFNVLAYDDDPEIKVILKEGVVSVLNSQFSTLKKMEAGYQLNYRKNRGVGAYSEINAEDYAGWIDGKLIFRNASMAEVVSRMKRWYGVEIEVLDPELLQLHFRATFVNENIEEAFKLLQSTATFNYHFAKRKSHEDGSFENTKISITKK